MDLYLSIVLLLFFLSLVLYFLGGKRPDNFPPGPAGYPVVGNALQFGATAYKVALDMKKKYGDIIGVRFGFQWAVILNNPEDIREAFGKSELSARQGYNFLIDDDVSQANHGVIMSTGKIWLDNRRFALRTLRDFGFGKRSMEAIIMEEVEALTVHFKKITDKPISTVKNFNLAVFNVIWSIVAGRRYSLDDAELSKMNGLLIKFLLGVFRGGRFLLLIFPSLVNVKKMFPFLFRNIGDDFRDDLYSFLGKTIQDHRATREEGSPRDFIDTYLDEQSKIMASESQTVDDKSDFDFIVLLMDLFIAGSETTSTTLCWSFFLLGLHPESQEKLFQELDSVIGAREVLLEDRSRLPYAEATVTEIYRMSSIVPFGVPHAATGDIKLKGYTIPKGAQVFANIYGSHFDPDQWEEPKKFMPERFLLDDGTIVKRSKSVIPFSVGKRSCLGESLARDETFLFLTNLVKTFKISMPSEEPSHSLEGVRGGVNTPEPHQVILSTRVK